MRHFGMGRSWAYRRLNVLVAHGLLVPRALLYRQGALRGDR
jgi:DNA-binding IclR family transcriptional regulator